MAPARGVAFYVKRITKRHRRNLFGHPAGAPAGQDLTNRSVFLARKRLRLF
jgi:hypothetical protein